MTVRKQETSNNYKMLLDMLVSVVYVACSKIIDNLTPLSITDMKPSHSNTNRSIQRIEILLKLLNSNTVFTNILLHHIAKLQGDRENVLSSPNLTKSWIFNEVSKLSNVIKYGTLKSSCRNYMETRLSHLFAGLISFCDINNNFDTLVNASKPWISNLWLQMFNDEQLVYINYSKHYLRAQNLKEKNEFICLSCPYLVQNKLASLSLKLPFSWVIKENLDNLTSSKIKENQFVSQRFSETDILNANLVSSVNSGKNNDEYINGSSKYFYEQLVNVFVNSAICEKLNAFLSDDQTKLEFINAYLNDYLLMSVTDSFIDKTHLEIFKKRVLDYCKLHYCKFSSNLDMLIGIHLSFDELKQELQLFTKFASLSHNILEIVDKSENSNVNLCLLASRSVFIIII